MPPSGDKDCVVSLSGNFHRFWPTQNAAPLIHSQTRSFLQLQMELWFCFNCFVMVCDQQLIYLGHLVPFYYLRQHMIFPWFYLFFWKLFLFWKDINICPWNWLQGWDKSLDSAAAFELLAFLGPCNGFSIGLLFWVANENLLGVVLWVSWKAQIWAVIWVLYLCNVISCNLCGVCHNVQPKCATSKWFSIVK